MPIYEYEPVRPEQACPECRGRFEVIQSLGEAPLTACPGCGRPVRKIVSWCRAAVSQPAEDDRRVESRVRDYEQAGQFSHAAELADKHSEKTGDKTLKSRAMDNYKKAGYDLD